MATNRNFVNKRSTAYNERKVNEKSVASRSGVDRYLVPIVGCIAIALTSMILRGLMDVHGGIVALIALLVALAVMSSMILFRRRRAARFEQEVNDARSRQ